MEDPLEYRVKFVDIRVKPPGKGKRKRGSAKPEPQPEQTCHKDDCNLPAGNPAPSRQGGRLWFCEKHITEYNRSYNFFSEMSEKELDDFNESAKHDHKTTWKLGRGAPVGRDRVANSHNPRHWQGRKGVDTDTGGTLDKRPKRRTALQIKSLNELDLAEDATSEMIRARYGEYVRQFHPDSNQGDRSTEEKLARVIKAGKTLKAAGLMKG